MTYKRCTGCLKEKSLKDFSPDNRARPDGKAGGKQSKCRRCMADWLNKHPVQRRINQLRIKFGMSPEQYDNMYTEQSGLCAICLRPLPDKRGGNVDHCHRTGKIRGLLDSTCNRGLGQMKDNPILLRHAAAYLERNS